MERTWEIQRIQLKGRFGAVPRSNSLWCDMPGDLGMCYSLFRDVQHLSCLLCYITSLLVN